MPGRGDLVFLDTGIDLPPEPVVEEAGPASLVPEASAPEIPLLEEAPPPDGLEHTEFAVDPLTPAGSGEDVEARPLGEPPTGLEQLIEADLLDEPVGQIAGFELGASVEEIDFEGLPLEELDPPDMSEVDAEPIDGLLETAEDLDFSLSTGEAGSTGSADTDLDLDFIEEDVPAGAPTAGLPLIDAAPTGAAADELAALEDRILENPDDPDLHRKLADRLLLVGDLGRAAEELRLSLQGYEGVEDWPGASAIAARLVDLEPDAIHNHQKRVELAFRTGERAPLLDAYLALGDALGRAGATDKAIAVYGRVQEHDPSNPRASAAIAALSAPPAHPPLRGSCDSISAPRALDAGRVRRPRRRPSSRPRTGELRGPGLDDLRGDRPPRHPHADRSPRARRTRTSSASSRRFSSSSSAASRRTSTPTTTRPTTTWAWRSRRWGCSTRQSPNFRRRCGPPRAACAPPRRSGMAFFEKGQFAVSEAVLRRAVDSADGGDEAKIGLIYWLGRALEAQGKGADAITSYERAMAVDIRFMDLSDRIHRLTAGRRE